MNSTHPKMKFRLPKNRTFHTILASLALGPILGLAPDSRGGEPSSANPDLSAVDPHCHTDRPDLLAPIGVMNDHAHAAGGLMCGYRFAWDHDRGLRKGSDPIPAGQVFRERAPDGKLYPATALEMEMSMHMFEIMYAPTDWVTLMLMPMYMDMTMTMRRAPGGMAGMAGMGGMGGGMGGMEHSHSSRGWSDLGLSAMFPLHEEDGDSLLFNLGLSLPTGAVDLRNKGMLTHYMMQLGSGTWDLQPGLTYTGSNDKFSWGLQSIANLRLEDQNSSGYSLGDALDTTAWVAVPLNDWLSLSGRAALHNEGDIEGGYNAPHRLNSPPDFTRNYGGDRVDLGVGLNVVVPGGPLAGHRFGIEALAPVHQDLKGIQLERQLSIIAGWTFHY